MPSAKPRPYPRRKDQKVVHRKKMDYSKRNMSGLMPPWEAGQSGNPLGKPRKKGNRVRLSEVFVGDVYEHWKIHGMDILDEAANTRPADYLKVVASILPKEIKVGLENLDESDLDRRIDELAQALGFELNRPKTIEAKANGKDSVPMEKVKDSASMED